MRHVRDLLRLGGRVVNLATLFIVSAAATYFLTDLLTPPQTPIKITVLNSPLKPGETLRYAAEFKRARLCRADVQRFVIKNHDTETEKIVYRDQIIGIMAQGTHTYVRTLSDMPLPVLSPGIYKLRLYVISTCTVVSLIAIYPDEEFVIE